MADSSALQLMREELAKLVLKRSQITGSFPALDAQITDANIILANDPQKWSTTTLIHQGAETSRQALQNWVDAKNSYRASLNAELASVNENIKSLNQSILDLQQSDLMVSNPNLALEQARIEAQKEADKIKATAEAEAIKIREASSTTTKLFAQKNTQYIIIGVVIVAVGLTAFILYKKFSK